MSHEIYSFTAKILLHCYLFIYLLTLNYAHFAFPPHTNLTFACFFFCCFFLCHWSSVTKRRKAHLKRLDRRWTLGGIVNRQQSRGDHGEGAWTFKFNFNEQMNLHTMTHICMWRIHVLNVKMWIFLDESPLVMRCRILTLQRPNTAKSFIYLQKLAELDSHLWGSGTRHQVSSRSSHLGGGESASTVNSPITLHQTGMLLISHWAVK